MEATQKITKDMLTGEVVATYPEAAKALMMVGMGCVSCPASQMESLADAAMLHGLDADLVVEYLNDSLNLND
jgi:hybrid cluster-associated redox disulfide protein